MNIQTEIWRYVPAENKIFNLTTYTEHEKPAHIIAGVSHAESIHLPY